MIFWKGRGIFILLFGVAGAMAFYKVAKNFGSGHLTESWLPAIALWGATLAVFLFSVLLGKGSDQIVTDPATRQQVRLKTEHSLYGLTGMSWVFLGVLSSIVLSFIAAKDPGDAVTGPRPSSPASKAFDDANRLISKYEQTEAFGNHEQAQEMAQEFAQLVKEGRAAGIESSRPSSASLSKGNFLTYCQLSGDKCAFLVHVPDLRHFTPEAKEWVGKLCWAVARSVCMKTQPAPKNLSVGIRGAFLYDRILTGVLASDNPSPDAGLSLTRKGDDSKEALYPYFSPSKNPSPVNNAEPTPVPAK